MEYALKNEDSELYLQAADTSTQLQMSILTDFLLQYNVQDMDSTQVTGGEIIGGKTGYTRKQVLCLASLAQIKGKEYILVTAKANGTHETEQFHILDAIHVYDQVGENAA